MVGNGGEWQVPSQNGGGLPIVTMPADQTKNQVILHVEHPTKPYQVAVLSERVVMVLLVWCRKPYQSLPNDRSGSPSILL